MSPLRTTPARKARTMKKPYFSCMGIFFLALVSCQKASNPAFVVDLIAGPTVITESGQPLSLHVTAHGFEALRVALYQQDDVLGDIALGSATRTSSGEFVYDATATFANKTYAFYALAFGETLRDPVVSNVAMVRVDIPLPSKSTAPPPLVEAVALSASTYTVDQPDTELVFAAKVTGSAMRVSLYERGDNGDVLIAYLTADPAEPGNYVYVLGDLAEGTYRYMVVAVDADGAPYPSNAIEITVAAMTDPVPDVAPSVALVADPITVTEAAATASLVATLSHVENADGPFSVGIYDQEDGSLIGDVTSVAGDQPATFSVPYVASDNGTHVYYARVTDGRGESARSEPVTVTVDILTLSLSVSDTKITHVGDSIELVALVSGLSLGSVDLYRSGNGGAEELVAWTDAGDANPGAYIYAFSAAENTVSGVYTYRAVATTSASDRRVDATQSVTVDILSVTLSAASDQVTIAGDSVELVAAVVGLSVESVTLYLNDGSGAGEQTISWDEPATVGPGMYRYTFPITDDTPNGVYSFRVEATTGTSKEEATQSVTVDVLSVSLSATSEQITSVDGSVELVAAVAGLSVESVALYLNDGSGEQMVAWDDPGAMEPGVYRHTFLATSDTLNGVYGFRVAAIAGVRQEEAMQSVVVDVLSVDLSVNGVDRVTSAGGKTELVAVVAGSGASVLLYQSLNGGAEVQVPWTSGSSGTGTYRYAFTAPGSDANGVYAFRVAATNRSGGVDANQSVTVDIFALDLSASGDLIAIAGDSVDVKAEVVGLSVKSVKLWVSRDGANEELVWKQNAGSTGVFSYTHTLQGDQFADNGTYVYRLEAFDDAGEQLGASAVSVTLDVTDVRLTRIGSKTISRSKDSVEIKATVRGNHVIKVTLYESVDGGSDHALAWEEESGDIHRYFLTPTDRRDNATYTYKVVVTNDGRPSLQSDDVVVIVDIEGVALNANTLSLMEAGRFVFTAKVLVPDFTDIDFVASTDGNTVKHVVATPSDDEDTFVFFLDVDDVAADVAYAIDVVAFAGSEEVAKSGLVAQVGDIGREIVADEASCTLIEAIEIANAGGAAQSSANCEIVGTSNGTADADWIKIRITAADKIALGGSHNEGNGLPLITGKVFIEGDGVGAQDIHREAGTGRYRIFSVWPGAELSLKNIALFSGFISSALGGLGGCIFNEGNLRLIDTVVGSCGAASAVGRSYGGGIYSQGSASVLSITRGSLTNNLVTISDADGEGAGGAVAVDGGTVEIGGVTISGNAVKGVGARYGGGIALLGVARGIVHGDSTIRANTAGSNISDGDAGGGGIYVRIAADTAVDLRDLVISSNELDDGGYGGGVLVDMAADVDESLAMTSVDLTGNHCHAVLDNSVERMAGCGLFVRNENAVASTLTVNLLKVMSSQNEMDLDNSSTGGTATLSGSGMGVGAGVIVNARQSTVAKNTIRTTSSGNVATFVAEGVGIMNEGDLNWNGALEENLILDENKVVVVDEAFVGRELVNYDQATLTGTVGSAAWPVRCDSMYSMWFDINAGASTDMGGALITCQQ